MASRSLNYGEHVCKICGKRFIAYAPRQACCSVKCSEENRRINSKNRDRGCSIECRIRKQRAGYLERQKKLDQMVKEANEHGMSYGKYVSMLEMQGTR